MKRAYLDLPRPSDAVYSSCISIAGWIDCEEEPASNLRIEARLDGELIGETNTLFVREDVCLAMDLQPEIATGFRFLASVNRNAREVREVEIVVTAFWPSGKQLEIGRCPVQLHPARFTEWPYGDVVHPTQERVLHRERIYGSGPPVEEPSAETLQLVRQYLPPRSSVLDVGCGAGAYGQPLRPAGYEWLGLEVSHLCCELLTKRDLPFRKMEEASRTLPVRDAEFDHAICIEVLEHIQETDIFLDEIARCTRGRALFSVPNLEVIPYFSAWQVVPWHLLEADHKNFFTRASLRALLQKHFKRVEVFSYAEHPLHTPDGIPLHAHLFAVADKV